MCTFHFGSIFPRYNNYSPFSSLYKCVEIMWFAVIFMEKNAKNKKKTRRSEKSLSSYLHNGSTLGHNSNRFWKLQCKASTFVFLTILGNGSCDHHPNLPLDGPWQVEWKRQATIWKVQWNILRQRMKYLMKAQGNYMKSIMKYPGVKNEISNESTRQPYEKCNEISWGKEWNI